MVELTTFLRWLIEYAISNGFWHFVAVVWIVGTITKITTLVKVTRTLNLNKKED